MSNKKIRIGFNSWGDPVYQDFRYHRDRGLWGINVGFGGFGGRGLVTNVRRHYFKTKEQAKHADISTHKGVVEVEHLD